MHNDVVNRVRDITASEFILGKIEDNNQGSEEGIRNEKQLVNPKMAFKMPTGIVYKG